MVQVNKELLKSKSFVKAFNRILKEGDPTTLTATSIRKELEDLFKLDRDSLKEQPWKKEINTMIDEYMTNLGNDEPRGNSSGSGHADVKSSAEEGEQQPNVIVKEDAMDQSDVNDDSNDAFEEAPTIQKRKRSAHSKKQNMMDSSDTDKDETSAPKKKQRQDDEQPVKKEKKSVHTSKSRALESLDEDKEGSESDASIATAPSPPKKKQRQPKKESAKKETKSASAHRTQKHIVDPLDEDVRPDSNSDDMDESESDGSSSEPPKKKEQQRKERPVKKGSGSKAKATSPDEETIKRLKAYIRKCGIPVIRQKELADCATLKSQIRKLKSMLVDLGVEGRPTNEKCEKIKVERELQAEIASLDTENILDSSSRGPSLRSRASTSRKKRHIVDDDDSDEADAPQPLDVSFLGDQSDDSD